jgi:hypothetical protein
LGSEAERGGVISAGNAPELLGTASGGVNHFGMAAGERDVLFIADEEYRKRARSDGFNRRDIRGGEAGEFFSAVEKGPSARSKQCLSQERKFSEAGVVVRGFAEIGKRSFGDHSLKTGIGGRRLQRDARTHGFAECKNVK